MAKHKSAIKRHKQSIKRRDRNRAARAQVKTIVREVREAISSGSSAQIPLQLRASESALASAGKKKILHKRTASRKISRLAKAAAKAAKK